MKIYKVIFEDNRAASAAPAKNLEHGDMGLTPDKEGVCWFALESPDASTALEIAERVVRMIWGDDSA